MKVLVFMESYPLTDKFEQVVLSEGQAKAMRDALFHIIAPNADATTDKVMFDVITNDDIEVVLPDVRDFYGPNYIKEAQEEDLA